MQICEKQETYMYLYGFNKIYFGFKFFSRAQSALS